MATPRNVSWIDRVQKLRKAAGLASMSIDTQKHRL